MRNPIVLTKSIDRFSKQDMAKISCKTLATGLSTDQFFSTELFFLQKKLEILKTRITQFHQRGEVSTRDGLTGVLSLYEEVIIDLNLMMMKDTKDTISLRGSDRIHSTPATQPHREFEMLFTLIIKSKIKSFTTGPNSCMGSSNKLSN